MATSGSYDFNLTGTEIITEALELLGVVGVGQTLSSEDKSKCLRTLEMMIKAWQAEGIGLWKNVTGTLALPYNTYSYDIGPAGNCAQSTLNKTEMSQAQSVGSISIFVDSADNISTGDYIGVELDDNTFQWSTVGGVSGNVVTMSDLTEDTISEDNYVYSYTTKIQRPIEIIEARRVDSSDIETPLSIISLDEYTRLSDKTSLGVATQLYYDPQLTNGKLYLWPAASTSTDRIKFTARIPIEDFDSSSNDPDFPQEWLMALSWNLAVYVAPKFGKTVDNLFLANAGTLKQAVKDFDHENTSVYIRRR